MYYTTVFVVGVEYWNQANLPVYTFNILYQAKSPVNHMFASATRFARDAGEWRAHADCP